MKPFHPSNLHFCHVVMLKYHCCLYLPLKRSLCFCLENTTVFKWKLVFGYLVYSIKVSSIVGWYSLYICHLALFRFVSATALCKSPFWCETEVLHVCTLYCKEATRSSYVNITRLCYAHDWLLLVLCSITFYIQQIIFLVEIWFVI